jgi:YVTN family beta-propeller protein
VHIGVVAAQDGQFVYVTNSFDSTVSAIQTYDNTLVDTVNVGFAPAGVAVSPDGSKVYETNRDDNSVGVIGTGNNIPSFAVKVGMRPTGVAVTPDGHFVYVANSDDNTESIITIPYTAVFTVNVDDNPFGVAITPKPPTGEGNLKPGGGCSISSSTYSNISFLVYLLIFAIIPVARFRIRRTNKKHC